MIQLQGEMCYHVQGRKPTRGWIPDDQGSTEALADLGFLVHIFGVGIDFPSDTVCGRVYSAFSHDECALPEANPLVSP